MNWHTKPNKNKIAIAQKDFGTKLCSKNIATKSKIIELTHPEKNIIVLEFKFFLNWLIVRI